ncbi:MAG: hypothetical protein U0Q15_06455 [Kineosporiaceae bacterium]
MTAPTATPSTAAPRPASAGIGVSRLELIPAALAPREVLDCELDVLGHWYGDTAQLLEDSYGPYVEQSAFLAVTRDDGLVLGAARVIGPGALPLKTVTDIGKEPWSVDGEAALAAAGVDLARTWDVATIAVRRELGAAGRGIAGALYHGLIHAAPGSGCPWLVSIIDRRARALLVAVGLPMHDVPGTGARHYMGSGACAPTWMHLPTTVERQRRLDPQAHGLVTQGRGLDVELPAPADLRWWAPGVARASAPPATTLLLPDAGLRAEGEADVVDVSRGESVPRLDPSVPAPRR